MVELPGILLVLCFVHLHSLPHLYLVSYSSFLLFSPVFSCALELLQFLISFFLSSSISTLPSFFSLQSSIFRACLIKRNGFLCSTLLPYTPKLQGSRPTSLHGTVFVLWEHQGTDHQANNYMTRANLFLLTEGLLDGAMLTWISSLTSELQCMCSHCGSCSNSLSICNSELESGKIHSQYFCIFTTNPTQHAHQNRGSEILMLVFGSVGPSLLSCFLKFLLDLLAGIFQHWTERIARIPPRELQFSSSSFWDVNCINPYLGW